MPRSALAWNSLWTGAALSTSSSRKPGQFWRADWFVAVTVTLAVLVLHQLTDVIGTLERRFYDFASTSSGRQPSARIAIIAIDDPSIANIGRWPWGRDVHAHLIDKLAAAKAKTIVYNTFFFEPQTERGLVFIRKLKEALGSQGNEATQQVIADAEQTLDSDVKLAASIRKAGNVLLPAYFTLGEPQGKADTPLPSYVARSTISENSGFSMPAISGQYPIAVIGAAAAGIGHLNQLNDVDGAVRDDPLLVNYYGRAVPSMALLAAATSLNLGPGDIRLNPGESVQIGKLRIKTDEAARMLTQFYKGKDGRPAFAMDSFYDVLSGKIAATKYRDKIVLVGATAAGVGTVFPAPGYAGLSLAELVAHMTSSILAEHFIVQPVWGNWAQRAAFLLVAAYLAALLPRLSARLGAGATAAFLVLLLGGEFALLSAAATWLKFMLPATLLLIGHLALTTRRYRPLTADAAYEHVAARGPDFKDPKARLNRARNLSETVLLAGGAVGKPMLGRYQIEKELGKGAMGVVYLGQDPKIGRVVAIKTLALSQEFEGEELIDARERFFREAETAGRLQHQNIVTIFDAGEEHDLAYIAMEFLKGRDLADYCKPGSLLPVPKVIAIIARVAEALAYAHRQHVVHRDIKPANVMYEPESDTVKVMDFGIARITDSSRTRTGLVLGTPSFMSPEQIAGKKVDGRSDLYSLAVMLFQMLTGVLPFRGDSMAELMHKIANEEAPDVRLLRPDLSERLADVVALALSKWPQTRYQDGERFAADLRSSLDRSPAGPVGQPGYDEPGDAAAPADTVFAKTKIMSRPAVPGAPAARDGKTDLEARPGKL